MVKIENHSPKSPKIEGGITMVNALIANLINIGWAMLIFLCAYLSNVSFSMYYNIKIMSEPFSKDKLINSG